MAEYNHKKIERKWQKEWERKKVYEAKSPSSRAKLATGQLERKKFYALIEFPYPSGDGLHVGHPRPYIGMDIISRKRRMQGYNVLYPIGWDAFGLPTENYAIKTGKDPRVVTKKNSDTFRRQIKSLGISFDWSREINTTDPKYYKWTQWIFLQFFKKGLAYKAKMTINWCSKDKIGLANEEVVNGCCERCGTPAEQREKEQWMLAITKYADRLYKDLDEVDYLPQIKLGQRNWIGKSEGAEIKFEIKYSPSPSLTLPFGEDLGGAIRVFTTRPDTIFGATYLVLAPEHPFLSRILLDMLANKKEVLQYIEAAKKKSEIEKTAENKTKTGVELKGIKAINPASGEEIPVWIADYVLATYGTGAIMAVPAHDERDWEFAKKYNLPIKQVIMPDNLDIKNPPQAGKEDTSRNVVHVILRDRKNKDVLLEFLKGDHWGDNKPINFIIGGVENDESEINAAIREIKEETGYTNVKFIEKIPFEVQARFFAAHKDVNRTIHVSALVFDLLGQERIEISEEEKKLHDLKWVSENEVCNTITIPDDKMIWKYFSEGNFAFTGEGILINSDKFSGMDSEKVKKEIVKFVGGKEKTTFKLRDWVFSRQRYWGEPIPLVFCENCRRRTSTGWVPVPEKDLPVELPKVKNYQPTESGESPLANISKWVNTTCPTCGGKAKRETDTMPNWAGSSWYYLRYADPKNNKEFASKKNLKYWLGNDPAVGGVNWYNGGNEHTTLHLLYSRFWHKFLFDLKLVPTSEPYLKRTSHGMILGEGGVKMSKSLGNVINPDDIVKTYGADTLRIYEMFMGPFDQSVAWSTDSIIGARRFIEKVWRIGEKVASTTESSFAGSLSPLTSGALPLGSSACETPRQGNSVMLAKLLNKTIKKVSEDIETMKFNTAISSLMIFVNEVGKFDLISQDVYETFLKLLSPFAPHITEDLWQTLGHEKSINFESWPIYDLSKIKTEEIKIVVQINGKVRTEIMIQTNEKEENVKEKALKNNIILKHIEGKDIKKTFYVKNRLINIVV
ncbi:class I tRNA ligase family protein [Candidatus Nomurabacteria bacterium]|nr:class I tRNA ligase family protein [Candidatus Nomurabacteria bacterium]